MFFGSYAITIHGNAFEFPLFGLPVTRTSFRMIRSVQILRGLAALAVVALHIKLVEAKKIPCQVAPDFFCLGDAGVDVFFVISGFIMIFIQPPPAAGFAYSQIKFLTNRFTRVFPPYWFAMLPLFFLWLKFPKMFNNHCDNQVDIIRSILLLPQDFTPLLGVGWSLIHEVYFYVAVSFALFFAWRGRLAFGCIWFAAIFAVNALADDTAFSNNRLLQLVLSPFSLTFLLGYFIGLGRVRLGRLTSQMGLFCLLAGLAALFINYRHIPSLGVYPDNNHFFRFFAYGIPCGLIVASGLILESRLPAIILRLRYLGDISYALYLIHPLIVTSFYLGFSRLHWNGFTASVTAEVICCLCCLLAAAVFHEKLEVKITRWLRNILERPAAKHE
jgi:exopolysaccharide production protein ExoZ